MKVVKNEAKPAVVKVVETIVMPEQPATFDLIGLSFEQMVLLTLLVGNTGSWGKAAAYQLYCDLADATGYRFTGNCDFKVELTNEALEAEIERLKPLQKA
ncbi:hypothetical protein vBPFY1MI_88 [Pseudomonas phage vB_PF_Y1-MI]|nr:hypothetical protein vBPFY1MI_88 [Pseudomonas phage vB_PF_Y1-MI]